VRISQAANHHRVPACKDFIVETGRNSLVALTKQRLPGAAQRLFPNTFVDLLFRQKYFVWLSATKDVSAVLPISGIAYVIIFAKESGLLTESLFERFFRPGVKPAFFTFAVGIKCRVEAAAVGCHFALKPVKCFVGDCFVFFVLCDCKCFGVKTE